MATWAGGLVSMLALVVLAAAVAAGRVPRLAARTSIVAVATATLAGIAFIVQFPSVPGMGVDRGIWLFVVAILAGIAAPVLVLRASRQGSS
jgi:branched-subunit amino acid ABC-type transport system permease component